MDGQVIDANNEARTSIVKIVPAIKTRNPSVPTSSLSNAPAITLNPNPAAAHPTALQPENTMNEFSAVDNVHPNRSDHRAATPVSTATPIHLPAVTSSRRGVLAAVIDFTSSCVADGRT